MNSATGAIELTRKLIRFNTINPESPEQPCSEYLGRLLESAGFCVERHEFAPKRTSLVARLNGRADAPPLAFASGPAVAADRVLGWRRLNAAHLFAGTNAGADGKPESARLRLGGRPHARARNSGRTAISHWPNCSIGSY